MHYTIIIIIIVVTFRTILLQFGMYDRKVILLYEITNLFLLLLEFYGYSVFLFNEES